MRSISAGALALFVTGTALGVGCRRTEAERAADRRADQIERRGAQAANQLRDEAREVRREADEQARAVREAVRAHAEDDDRTGAASGKTPHASMDEQLARGGGPVALDTAVAEYARARCEREARCANIGAGRHWASRDACLEEQRAHAWDARSCHTVVRRELDECLAAIRSDDCGNPFDDMARLAACRRGEVCAH